MSDQWSFVIVAYALTWVTLVGYAAYVATRSRRARRLAEGGDA